MLRLFLFLFLGSILYAQELPRFMTEEERALMRGYEYPVLTDAFTTPPPQRVRTMAEWEPLEGIMITWRSFPEILRQIVDYAQEEGKVFIVCTDSNTVKSYLSSGGVPFTNLEFIIANSNSIWCRDYGPWTVYADDADSMYIIDWKYNRPRPADDVIPGILAQYYGVPVYSTTTAPYDFINTGGNFFTDGVSQGFCEELVLSENPNKTEAEIDTIMSLFMGINPYHKLENLPYDGIHHIDMHMKQLDEETLLVGEYPPGVADGPQIEENLDYIKNNIRSPYNHPFKIVRIPMPPDQFNRYPDGGGYYRTYTNSLIVNKTVIVPTYEEKYDTTALRIYREAMPGYNVVGIESNDIIPLLGTIHCITKEIGVKDPVWINHVPPYYAVSDGSGYEITAVIKAYGGVSNASVYWTTDTTTAFQETAMTPAGSDTFTVTLPNQPLGTKVSYYFEASSPTRTVFYPQTAPYKHYYFTTGALVPVELVSFTASIMNSDILLQWRTASELNNRGFEIQRTDEQGKAKGLWSTIGFVEGAGSSADVRDYLFNDSPAAGSVYYYRLKQIDYDGRYDFSNFIRVSTFPSAFVLQQNYPNPFNPNTTITYSLPRSVTVRLTLHNVLGEQILILDKGTREAGEHRIKFDAGRLPSGVYFYRLHADTFVETKKMILMK